VYSSKLSWLGGATGTEISNQISALSCIGLHGGEIQKASLVDVDTIVERGKNEERRSTWK